MQHADAIRSMASEKYLLDELTPELRAEFEEHVFDCPECALDVRAGTAFLQQSKVALSEPTLASAPASARSQPSPGWLAWLRPVIALPVMALLLIVIGVLTFVTLPKTRREIADLSAPQILPSATLASVRSDHIPVVTVSPHHSFLLFVDIPADNRFVSDMCELTSPSGTILWSLPVSADVARNTLTLQVPSGPAVSGTYTLTVNGITARHDQALLARYPFELQPRP